MNIKEWLEVATTQFKTANIPTPRLDAELLIASELKISRAELLAHPERKLKSGELQQLRQQTERRANHEPIAYILGYKEFYSREFLVSPKVLVPRPESETIIDLLKKHLSNYQKELRLLDIGAGSGCLGITAKLEIPDLKITLLDISTEALKIAQTNAEKFSLPAQFIKSNLLQNYSKPTDIILANLPYVANNFPINSEANHEPELAIFGGEDGLDYYRQMFSQIQNNKPIRPSWIFTESLPPEHSNLQKIANKYGFMEIDRKDLVQVFKPLKQTSQK